MIIEYDEINERAARLGQLWPVEYVGGMREPDATNWLRTLEHFAAELIESEHFTPITERQWIDVQFETGDWRGRWADPGDSIEGIAILVAYWSATNVIAAGAGIRNVAALEARSTSGDLLALLGDWENAA